MTTDIGTLIERVEASMGPDRELDRALVEAFGKQGANGVYRCAGSIGVAQLTGSIDASSLLVEELLPSYAWRTGRVLGNGWAHLHLRSPQIDDRRDMIRVAPTPPLAILSAILRSLQEKSNG